jgi:hypothetical protein
MATSRGARDVEGNACGATCTGASEGCGSGGILAALPIPLGSLRTLLGPPGLAGPVGMPLIAAEPAPADPANGCPVCATHTAGQASHAASASITGLPSI